MASVRHKRSASKQALESIWSETEDDLAAELVGLDFGLGDMASPRRKQVLSPAVGPRDKSEEESRAEARAETRRRKARKVAAKKKAREREAKMAAMSLPPISSTAADESVMSFKKPSKRMRRRRAHHRSKSSTKLETELDFSHPKFKTADLQTRAQIIAKYLLRVPVLAKLREKDRHRLGRVFRDKAFAAGEDIIKQGDEGHEFFIITAGIAAVVVSGNEVATLKSSDYFGETALLTEAPRNATIRAKDSRVCCLVLEKRSFTKVFSKDRLKVHFGKRGAVTGDVGVAPGSSSALASESGGSGKKAEDSGTAKVSRVYEKSERLRELLASAVENNVLFATLDSEQISRIVEVMWRMEVASEQLLIKQGTSGDNFYVVESGMFEVFVERGGVAKRVATRTVGESFGELALMYNSPRSATVKARTTAVVWAVERHMFRKILIRVSEDKLHEYERFLGEVPIFDTLLSYERRNVAEALDEVRYKGGDVVVKQGSKGDSFFLIRKGKALVFKADLSAQELADAESAGVPVTAREVARLGKGDFFGERALLKNDVRAATVRVCEDCNMTCLVLDREAFKMLLGPIQDLLCRKIDVEYDGKVSADGASAMTAGTEAGAGGKALHYAARRDALTWKPLEKEELTVVGILGKGSFGSVELVKHSGTGATFALKSVAKWQVASTGQQMHLLSEKKAGMLLDSPFLVKLYQTYKDPHCLYFLLEVVLGGELFTQLRTRAVFEESEARFYAASVISAFDYMHSYDIIYRDLKPENLLLDDLGYLKIADFGFAKQLSEESGYRTYTLCGTPDYLAPEVVSGTGHGKGVDWWTLGILVFEMLVGNAPFFDDDPMRTYVKIMYGKVNYKKYRHLSRTSISLIRGLLQAKPTKRLGIIHGGAAKLHKHEWFKAFDWNALWTRTMRAPIIPEIAGETDRSNFDTAIYDDDDIEDAERLADYVDVEDDWTEF